MMNIHCILHPTDFSEYSKNAFHVAVALARDYGARLIALHVAPIPAIGAGGLYPLPPPTESHTEEFEAELQTLKSPDPKVRLEHRLEMGDAVQGILDLAQETQCDLIVMGTHGRTGLGRLLMGSVAEKVVRKAPCPVLTIKMPMAETQGVREAELAGAGRAR